MKATLLLITWIIAGHGASSYQVQFGSQEACQVAREAVLKDADRVAGSILLPNGMPQPPAGDKTDGARSPVVVSAVCAPVGSN
jgi:hypothetical protein